MDAMKRNKTSITDNNEYPSLCLAASMDEALFSNFRRNPVYNLVLEHVSESQGQQYLDVISRDGRPNFSDEDWDDFHKNDRYGNPRTCIYEINGKHRDLSPTTLRYVKVLQDIMMLCQEKRIHSVAEIGVGYGGQCRIMTSYLQEIEKYHLIDLPEVLELVKKYLGKFGGKESYLFVDGTQISGNESYDLVISNYAFSELMREVQDIYLDKVIANSKAGYITWNPLSFKMLNGYSVEELLDRIPGAFVVDEEPLTFEGNCIILWKNFPKQ